MPRSVVTGGAGFIGSHLVDALLADGRDVVVIDDFRSGREENLAAAEGSIELIRADIAHDPIDDAFHPGDTVFHLAGMADIVPSIEEPRRYFESNVLGTLNVLEAARAADVSRVVYVASSTCYGIPKEYPTSEDTPCDPQYPYAQTKLQGEELILHWCKCYALPTLSLRFFNVFGPRARTSGTYGAVFGVFLAQKLNGAPYTVVGDGEQKRDFTYVSDVVQALKVAAESSVTGEAINIASGKPQTVNRLVELLGGDTVNVPKRPGEPDCTWADITKAQELLGWSPSVPFEEGVALMLERIEDWRDAPIWTPEAVDEATASWFEYLAR